MEKSKDYSKYSFENITPEIIQIEKSDKIKEFVLKNKLLLSTVVGVITGIVLGFILRPYNLGSEAILLISYPGELFMRVLKTMMLPLTISSLIVGSSSLNAKMNGKIAIRTLIYFVLTSMFNAFLGICLAVAIHPGDSGTKRSVVGGTNDADNLNLMDSLLDLGRNIFPENLFQAAFQQTHTAYVLKNDNKNDESFKRVLKYRPGMNTLGILFFCLSFGAVLGTTPKRSKVVIEFFNVVFEVVMKVVRGIMLVTPVGVCSIIVGKILESEDIGLIMSQLGLFIVTVTIGIFLYQWLLMQLIYFILIRKNPYHLYFNLMEAILTAAATASTAATLPTTFKCMEERLKFDKRITRFVLPIGVSINTDGGAMFLSIASIFIVQLNNMDIGIGGLCIVLFTTTIASFTATSVPSAGLVMILIILSSIGAPTGDVSLLFTVDWLLDRFRTVNNMLGDCYTAAIVEHLSKDELQKCSEDEEINEGNNVLEGNSSKNCETELTEFVKQTELEEN